MKNQNAPKGMSAKPDYESSFSERFCSALLGSRACKLEHYRAFLVVVDDGRGDSRPVAIFPDPRDARRAVAECRYIFAGQFIGAKIFPLEIPRHYFK